MRIGSDMISKRKTKWQGHLLILFLKPLLYKVFVYPNLAVCVVENDLPQNPRELQKKVMLVDANVDETYVETADINIEFHFVYQISLKAYPPNTARVYSKLTDSFASTSTMPLLINVRHSKGTLNWNLPYHGGEREYTFMDRTLCLLDEDDIKYGYSDILDKFETITVIVSTSSYIPIEFDLKLRLVDNFVANVNQMPHSVKRVSTTTPVIHFIDLKNVAKDSL